MDNDNSPYLMNPMPISRFQAVRGLVTTISDYDTNKEFGRGCTKMYTVKDTFGNIVNFVITPDTYFVDNVKVYEGMPVVLYYDATLPTILIYPPQYKAIVAAIDNQWQNIKVDRFGPELISEDGLLQLNITSMTEIILENGQDFWGNLQGRDLIVIFGPSTRSIPSLTTPNQIIVICQGE